MPLPQSTPRIERMTVRQRAFSQLRGWIEDGTLAPGETLRDHDIAQQLGISRTPVREALQMLEQLGGVETVPGSHTRVADATLEDINLVLEPLAALQAVAVARATPQITPDDVERLQQATAAMKKALRTGDALAARRADDDFHNVFIERCNNPYLQAAIGPLTHHARRLDGLYFADLEMTAIAVDDHTAILEAVCAGKADRAADLTRKDWAKSRQRVKRASSTANTRQSTTPSGRRSRRSQRAPKAKGTSR
jgi:DNA-binding GntR family transcriptional regulator